MEEERKERKNGWMKGRKKETRKERKNKREKKRSKKEMKAWLFGQCQCRKNRSCRRSIHTFRECFMGILGSGNTEEYSCYVLPVQSNPVHMDF